MKAVANKDCELKLQSGDGTITITSKPSTNVGLNAYAGPMAISVAAYTGGPVANKSGVGAGSIQPTILNCKAGGKLFIVEGDKVQVTITGTTADGKPATNVDTVTVTKAGQNKYQAG